jgi:hypothetical protein
VYGLPPAPWSAFAALVGGLLAMWWTLGALPAVRGRGEDHDPGDTFGDAIGVGRVEVSDVEDDGHRRVVTGRLTVATRSALQAARGLVAVRAGAPETGVVVTADPRHLDDSARFRMTITRRDVLRTLGEWPGPSHPGESVTLPVHSGVREDGTVVESRRTNNHRLVGGVTGAGKTEGMLTELADVITRRDVCLLWGDPIKAEQTLPDIAPAVYLVATTEMEIARLLRAVLTVVSYRAGIVRGRSFTPTTTVPFIDLTIDEAAGMDALGEDLRQVVSTVRSIGGRVTLGLQRPAGDLLDTTTRSQFTDRAGYAVTRVEDTDMVLSDTTIEAGARPETWGAQLEEGDPRRKVGYHYREAGPADRHAMPARTWRIDPARLRAHVAEWAPRLARLDEGTTRLLAAAELTSGAEWALAHGWARTAGGAWVPPDVEAETAGTVETVPLWGTAGPETSTETGDDMTGPLSGDDPDLTDEERRMIRRDDETARAEAEDLVGRALAEDEADDAREGYDDGPVPPAAELEPGEDWPLWSGEEEGAERLSYEQRIAAIADVLDQLLGEAGAGVVSTRALITRLVDVPGWSTADRPATYRVLELLSDAGYVRHVERGRWQVDGPAAGWLREHVASLAVEVRDAEAAEDAAERGPGSTEGDERVPAGG